MSIIQNAVYIPEDDFYLVSSHRHDFATWTSKDGKTEYSLDGGCDYFRSVGSLHLLKSGRIVSYHLEDSDPFEVIAAKLLWGTRGKKGDQTLKYRPIMEFTLPHLRAIVKTQPQISGTIYEQVVRYWIEQKVEENKMRQANKINN